MTQAWFTEPINEVRRKKNAVNDEQWIREFLRKGRYGILATEHEGQPFAYGRLYAYTAENSEGRHGGGALGAEGLGVLYLHGAKQGRTRTNMEVNPRVCFTVSATGDLLRGDAAVKFDIEYASVVLFGLLSVVENEPEAYLGLDLLMKKYFSDLEPGRDYMGVQAVDLHRTSVYRLDIHQWSAKTNTQKELTLSPGS